MFHVGMEAESFADLAFFLYSIALGYLIDVLYLERRVGVVGEVDLYADFGVDLLEDVAGD